MRATATGPGIFRSLGLKNPSGYWFLRRSTYSHTGEGCGQCLGAYMCSLCVGWCIHQAWPGGKNGQPNDERAASSVASTGIEPTPA